MLYLYKFCTDSKNSKEKKRMTERESVELIRTFVERAALSKYLGRF